MRRILAIETSCDETAAAVIGDGRHVLSNVVASQEALHAPYGGVFPELASRQHILSIVPVIEEALTKAAVGWGDLDALAVTYGPGLAGSLLVGVNTAKALSLARGLPLVGVNHLEGHIYANWLRVPPNEDKPDPEFPLVCLIVSGGHTDLVLMTGHARYLALGSTLDDAAGEAFDKVARMLGLGYPGGPAIQRTAGGGDPGALTLPRAWLPGTYDFSFSGLKTAVLRLTREIEAAGGDIPVADVARAFQDAVVDVLVTKTVQAAAAYGAREVLLAGGVAANAALREAIAAQSPAPVRYPAIWLCTDNAAMIGAAGYFAWDDGRRSGWDLDVVPSLPLVPA
ncbi:MAG: tRNA (adenosine(37)-N6)-threonylcarbamoyltransferase complex transferase subunit TsaD [Anaerolineae bacterium]|nr:tRNA (adenosine(37)-N6)-threonylcarbamoyltransferase complex transferase subunit TsaD [Anaerolineae bacterium]